MAKAISSLFAASAIAAVLSIPAYAQEAPKPAAVPAAEAVTSAPAGPKSDAEAKLDALLKQNELLQKQLDELKAEKAAKAEAVDTAKAVENEKAWVEGFRATVRNTGTTWTYGDPHIGPVEADSLKAFDIAETTISLAKLYKQTAGLPKGKPYGFVLTGKLVADKPGDYGLSVGMTAKVPNKGATIGGSVYHWDVCATSVKIQGQPVFAEEGNVGRERYNDGQFSLSAAKTVTLSKPGKYDFEAVINCSGPAYNPGFDAKWTLKVRQPGADEPSTPPATMFVHETPST